MSNPLVPSLPNAAAVRAQEEGVCLHCSQPIGERAGDFCCDGCAGVYRLLRDQGLGRYYDLRGDDGVPVTDMTDGRDMKWLEPFEQELKSAQGVCRLNLDVQGVHCAACVWLMEELFRREEGGMRMVVNPALGRVELAVAPSFELRRFLGGIEKFGYLFGPPLKADSSKTDELLVRTGVTVALAGNSMMFAAAIYLGLSEGPLYELMHQLNYALAAVAVWVGGSVFIRSSIQGLRRRVLHLDTPIALGIVLAFLGSTWSFFTQSGRASYFDTVAVFIALMLLGRWLQERVVERNRRQLLASDGAEGILVRRLRDGHVALVRCPELIEGDELILAKGDLVPVDAELLDATADCSLDWINGESEPRPFGMGDTLPAGAFNASAGAVRVRAKHAFGDSPLRSLLSVQGDDERWGQTRFWQRFAQVYVILVLLAGFSGFAYWWLWVGDLVKALEVATAVLVVTCPCAFGIATPLAYELVQGGLRRVGLFVRRPGFLDRARQVTQVVFDKTGTLTTGTLALANPELLEALSAEERHILYDLAARSAHPKSLVVKRALDAMGVVLDPSAQVHEVTGRGMSMTRGGRCYRLGAPFWVAEGDTRVTDADVVFGVDTEVLAALRTRETTRSDVGAQMARFSREGFKTFVLSGDAEPKVRAFARTIGVPEAHAIGDQTPMSKAEWLSAHQPETTLMVGDGINDSLAVERTLCAGTPAVDRPFMPSKSDFYVTTPGIAPIGLALRASRALAQIIRRNLVLAVLYNVSAVALAWAGLMQPWIAAVLMPASSLLILAHTSAGLSRRNSLWKS